MKKITAGLLLALAALPAFATSQYDKSGFVTKIEDGRLWVFAAGSKELAAFEQHGEPTIAVSRIGEGPEGMTLRGPSSEVLDAYQAAK